MRLTQHWLARLIRDAILVMALSIFMLSFAPAPLRAGPLENFFKRVRHALDEGANRPKPVRAPKQKIAESSEQSVHSPPNETNTSTTRRTVVSKSGKSNLPYGTPVPGKKGFVTSPFSPDGGYIDVRDFPPGTEVKDPYSGKTFRTP